MTAARDQLKKTNSVTSFSASLDCAISMNKGNGSAQDIIKVKARLWPEESRGRKIISTAIVFYLISKHEGYDIESCPTDTCTVNSDTRIFYLQKLLLQGEASKSI